MRRRANKVSQAFGAVLRSYREQAGLTQEQLALDASADRTFIWRLENGRTQPSLALLISLAEVMQVDPAELVSKTVSRLSTTRTKSGQTRVP
jgi:transcriptional regulator with XRE-family HTH domain